MFRPCRADISQTCCARVRNATVVVQLPDDPSQKLPKSLLRRYEVVIKPRNSVKPLKMRDIKATCIGHLVTLRVRDSVLKTAGCNSADMFSAMSQHLADVRCWSLGWLVANVEAALGATAFTWQLNPVVQTGTLFVSKATMPVGAALQSSSTCMVCVSNRAL